MIAVRFEDVGTMQNLGVLGLCVVALTLLWFIRGDR